MFRPDVEVVNDRMKLIMDRLIAKRIRQDPELVRRAYDWLRDLRDSAGDEGHEWWMEEWLQVLERGDDEVCAFIHSRGQYERQMANASPLYSAPAIGDMFHDTQLRRRLLNKARDGLILLHERHETTEDSPYGRTTHDRRP
jgi:hypothetical protein